jgi:hypothetical protein
MAGDRDFQGCRHVVTPLPNNRGDQSDQRLPLSLSPFSNTLTIGFLN